MRWQTTDPIGFQDSLNLYCYVHNNPFCYKDPDGRIAFLIAIPLIEIAFGTTFMTVVLPEVGTYLAYAAITYATCKAGAYVGSKMNNHEHTNNIEKDKEEKKEDKREKFKFPENPDELLPDLPRDKDGLIQTADNLRIRPEKHQIRENDTYNPRHHDQHYHIETRRNPSGSWKKTQNIELIKPPGYYDGMGTGFSPGEHYPGI